MRRKLSDILPTGAGPDNVPYDRTNTQPTTAAATSMTPTQPVPNQPSGLLAGMSTDQTPTDALPSPDTTMEDSIYEEMVAALNDPNTSPQDRAMIEQQLELAARRQLMQGLGG